MAQDESEPLTLGGSALVPADAPLRAELRGQSKPHVKARCRHRAFDASPPSPSEVGPGADRRARSSRPARGYVRKNQRT